MRRGDRIRALWSPDEEPAEFDWTNGAWRVRLVPRDKSAYGLVIRTGDDAFTLAGKGYAATFSCRDAARAPCMLEVGEFDEHGLRRFLNGDEVMEWGLCVSPGIKRRTREYSGDYRAGGASLYVAEAYKSEVYPGILRVKLGRRDVLNQPSRENEADLSGF